MDEDLGHGDIPSLWTLGCHLLQALLLWRVDSLLLGMEIWMNMKTPLGTPPLDNDETLNHVGASFG